MTGAQIARGLNVVADRYSKAADKAEDSAKTDAQRASYLTGRAQVFREAAIDFRSMADLAVQEVEA